MFHKTILLIRFISLSLITTLLLQEGSWAFSLVPAPSPDASKKTMASQPFGLSIPSEHAIVKEFYQGKSNKRIIYLQDAHGNLSGQLNLSETLKALLPQVPTNTVLVEGGYGNVSLDELKANRSSEEWKSPAYKLLHQGKISGEEYLALTQDQSLDLQGIESPELYRQGVEHYSNLRQAREEWMDDLLKISQAIDRLKSRIFPHALYEYEQADLNPMEQIQRLLILRKSAVKNAEEFLKDSSPSEWFEKIQKFETDVYRELLEDTEAIQLHQVDQWVQYTIQGLKSQLSSEEFETWQELSAQLSWLKVIAFVNRQLLEQKIAEGILPYEAAMENLGPSIRDFFANVSLRDQEFIKHIRAELQKQDTVFLITGGYHTAHLTTLLEKSDYSYLVLAPLITSESDLRQYEALLLDYSSIHEGKEADENLFLNYIRVLAARLAPDRYQELGEFAQLGSSENTLTVKSPILGARFGDYYRRLNLFRDKIQALAQEHNSYILALSGISSASSREIVKQQKILSQIEKVVQKLNEFLSQYRKYSQLPSSDFINRIGLLLQEIYFSTESGKNERLLEDREKTMRILETEFDYLYYEAQFLDWSIDVEGDGSDAYYFQQLNALVQMDHHIESIVNQPSDIQLLQSNQIDELRAVSKKVREIFVELWIGEADYNPQGLTMDHAMYDWWQDLAFSLYNILSLDNVPTVIGVLPISDVLMPTSSSPSRALLIFDQLEQIKSLYEKMTAQMLNVHVSDLSVSMLLKEIDQRKLDLGNFLDILKRSVAKKNESIPLAPADSLLHDANERLARSRVYLKQNQWILAWAMVAIAQIRLGQSEHAISSEIYRDFQRLWPNAESVLIDLTYKIYESSHYESRYIHAGRIVHHFDWLLLSLEMMRVWMVNSQVDSQWIESLEDLEVRASKFYANSIKYRQWNSGSDIASLKKEWNRLIHMPLMALLSQMNTQFANQPHESRDIFAAISEAVRESDLIVQGRLNHEEWTAAVMLRFTQIAHSVFSTFDKDNPSTLVMLDANASLKQSLDDALAEADAYVATLEEPTAVFNSSITLTERHRVLDKLSSTLDATHEVIRKISDHSYDRYPGKLPIWDLKIFMAIKSHLMLAYKAILDDSNMTPQVASRLTPDSLELPPTYFESQWRKLAVVARNLSRYIEENRGKSIGDVSVQQLKDVNALLKGDYFASLYNTRDEIPLLWREIPKKRDYSSKVEEIKADAARRQALRDRHAQLQEMLKVLAPYYEAFKTNPDGESVRHTYFTRTFIDLYHGLTWLSRIHLYVHRFDYGSPNKYDNLHIGLLDELFSKTQELAKHIRSAQLSFHGIDEQNELEGIRNQLLDYLDTQNDRFDVDLMGQLLAMPFGLVVEPDAAHVEHRWHAHFVAWRERWRQMVEKPLEDEWVGQLLDMNAKTHILKLLEEIRVHLNEYDRNIKASLEDWGSTSQAFILFKAEQHLEAFLAKQHLAPWEEADNEVIKRMYGRLRFALMDLLDSSKFRDFRNPDDANAKFLNAIQHFCLSPKLAHNAYMKKSLQMNRIQQRPSDELLTEDNDPLAAELQDQEYAVMAELKSAIELLKMFHRRSTKASYQRMSHERLGTVLLAAQRKFKSITSNDKDDEPASNTHRPLEQAKWVFEKVMEAYKDHDYQTMTIRLIQAHLLTLIAKAQQPGSTDMPNVFDEVSAALQKTYKGRLREVRHLYPSWQWLDYLMQIAREVVSAESKFLRWTDANFEEDSLVIDSDVPLEAAETFMYSYFEYLHRKLRAFPSKITAADIGGEQWISASSEINSDLSEPFGINITLALRGLRVRGYKPKSALYDRFEALNETHVTFKHYAEYVQPNDFSLVDKSYKIAVITLNSQTKFLESLDSYESYGHSVVMDDVSEIMEMIRDFQLSIELTNKPEVLTGEQYLSLIPRTIHAVMEKDILPLLEEAKERMDGLERKSAEYDEAEKIYKHYQNLVRQLGLVYLLIQDIPYEGDSASRLNAGVQANVGEIPWDRLNVEEQELLRGLSKVRLEEGKIYPVAVQEGIYVVESTLMKNSLSSVRPSSAISSKEGDLFFQPLQKSRKSFEDSLIASRRSV